MNRQGLEEVSRKMTDEYGRMLQEMCLESVVDEIHNSDQLSVYYYIRVVSVSAKWIQDDKTIYEYMSNAYVGLHSFACPVSFLFISDRGVASFFLTRKIDLFLSSYRWANR